MNMEVVVARDAESALEILADRSRSLSLLITDVAMPGIDGMELVRRARSTRARLPVLFITAYRSANVTELIARDKMAARLEKPFQTDDLTRAVRDLMAR
jgi:DNA-binding NtrC family response regulator